jgi:hypothetical protein
MPKFLQTLDQWLQLTLSDSKESTEDKIEAVEEIIQWYRGWSTMGIPKEITQASEDLQNQFKLALLLIDQSMINLH